MSTSFAEFALDHCTWCGQPGHNERACMALDEPVYSDSAKVQDAVLRALGCRDEYLAAGYSVDDASARAFHHLLGGLAQLAGVTTQIDAAGVLRVVAQVRR